MPQLRDRATIKCPERLSDYMLMSVEEKREYDYQKQYGEPSNCGYAMPAVAMAANNHEDDDAEGLVALRHDFGVISFEKEVAKALPGHCADPQISPGHGGDPPSVVWRKVKEREFLAHAPIKTARLAQEARLVAENTRKAVGASEAGKKITMGKYGTIGIGVGDDRAGDANDARDNGMEFWSDGDMTVTDVPCDDVVTMEVDDEDRNGSEELPETRNSLSIYDSTASEDVSGGPASSSSSSSSSSCASLEDFFSKLTPIPDHAGGLGSTSTSDPILGDADDLYASYSYPPVPSARHSSSDMQWFLESKTTASRAQRHANTSTNTAHAGANLAELDRDAPLGGPASMLPFKPQENPLRTGVFPDGRTHLAFCGCGSGSLCHSRNNNDSKPRPPCGETPRSLILPQRKEEPAARASYSYGRE